MTIYNKLLTMGHTDEQIQAAANTHPEPGSVTLSLYDTPDGPIVGLVYTTNHADEELGVVSLTEAVTGRDRWHPFILEGKDAHYAQFSDVPGASLVLGVMPVKKPLAWGEDINSDVRVSLPGGDYAVWWERALGRTQGRVDAFSLKDKSMPVLREMAAVVGVEKPARTKAPLIEQVVAASVPGVVNRWPGWFDYGRVLVLRADSGVVADVLNLLHVAAMEGTLGFGGGGFGPGLSFYDAADIGPKYHTQLWLHMKFVKKHERKLISVRRRLEAAGWFFWSLGYPEALDGVVKYWVEADRGNSSSGGGGGYISGWFSLAELKKMAVKDKSGDV